MNPVQEMIEIQERLYTLRDELARAATRPQAGDEQHQRHAAAADRLASIESGLYPVCVSCGQRIEIEVLQNDAMADHCASCTVQH